MAQRYRRRQSSVASKSTLRSSVDSGAGRTADEQRVNRNDGRSQQRSRATHRMSETSARTSVTNNQSLPPLRPLLGSIDGHRQPVESREEEELDDHSAIIMAVDLRERGTVGCAYYVAQSETLYLLEEAKFGNAEVIDMRKDFVLYSSGYSDILQVKSYISPTIVIATNRADDAVVDVLDPGLRSRALNTGSGIVFIPDHKAFLIFV